jgi:hypothetical protein
MTMVLTCRQPVPRWFVEGWKTIETRSRRTHYRGPVLLHGGRRALRAACPDSGTCHHDCAEICHRTRCCGPLSFTGWDDWPTPIEGVFAVAQLVECVPIVTSLPAREHGGVVLRRQRAEYHAPSAHWPVPIVDITDQLRYGDFTPGGFAYIFEQIRQLNDPIPIAGRQGSPLWAAPRQLLDGVHAQLAE